MRGLKLGLSIGRGNANRAAFGVSLTGLSTDSLGLYAEVGDHLGIGYTINPDNGTETVKWSNSADPADPATYGTGAAPTDYTAGDEGTLYLHVTEGAAFSPLSLFASGEQGAWYDPSDLSTLWKDEAGTDPVTTAGDVVARVDDKSGNGNHLTQASVPARPRYRTAGGLHWLEFDGVDDGLISGAMTPGTDKVQAFAGVRKASDAAPAVVAEHGNNSSLAWYMSAPQTSVGANFGMRINFIGAPNIVALSGTDAQPVTRVVTGLGDGAGGSVSIRTDGILRSTETFTGTGDFSPLALSVGRRANGTIPFTGNMYGLIVRYGAPLGAETIAATETYLAAKTGVVI